MAFPTYIEIRRAKGGFAKGLYDEIKKLAEGILPTGSISTDELANGAVTEGKLATGAVTSGKLGAKAVTTAKIDDLAVGSGQIAAGAVTAAKFAGATKSYASDGVTAAKLTANIADPATLPDGFVAVVKDTADSDNIKLVVVYNHVFYVGAALTAGV